MSWLWLAVYGSRLVHDDKRPYHIPEPVTLLLVELDKLLTPACAR